MANSTTPDVPPPTSPSPGIATLPPPYGEIDVATLPRDFLQTNIVVCAVLTFVAAALFVAARFYTRWAIRRILGWEDYVILAALVFSGANSAGMIEQAHFGLGSHIWQLKEEQRIPLSRAGWYTILWYMLSLACTKISILLLYFRILVFDWIRKATYGLLALVVATGLFAVACALTACVPIEAWWDPLNHPGAVCHSQTWWWANTGLHLATDFLIFLLPLPVIFTLRTNWRQRVLLYSIFMFGFFICAISVFRLWIMINYADHWDFSYDTVRISYWTCIEVNFAIICACQMTLKPLISKFFPTLFRDRRNNNNDSNDLNPQQQLQQHAIMSIGGRPFSLGGGGARSNIKRSNGSTAAAGTEVGSDRNKRRSWILAAGPAVANHRLESEAAIAEDDDAVTLADLESGGTRSKGYLEDVEQPRSVHLQVSSDRLSEMGSEVRAESIRDA